MLFRKSDGSIIEVKKTEYKNDISYYTNLMKIKTETRTKPTTTTTTKTTTTTTTTTTATTTTTTATTTTTTHPAVDRQGVRLTPIKSMVPRTSAL